MNGKALIIFVAGFVMIGGVTFHRIAATSTDIVANFDQYYFRQTAQNVAQSGVNMGLRQLAVNKLWRTGFPLMNVFGGKVVVTATDFTWSGRPVVKVMSVGIINYGNSMERRDTSIAYVPRATIPPSLKGALTTNRPGTLSTSLEGNPLVDGRDHTIANVLIPNAGTYAIWTTGTMSPQGNPKLGGTVAGVDIAPADPYNPAVVKTGATWSGGMSPDSVIGGPAAGFPEGTLKAIAQSGGVNQYVTNPALLSYPLKGVTYVEPATGTYLQSKNITGTGILIVHNSAKTATLKDDNLYFTGLVLVDDCWKENDIPHIGTPTLLGAIVGLTPNVGANERWGNSEGSYIYSSEAIRMGIETVYGSGNGSQAGVLAWWE